MTISQNKPFVGWLVGLLSLLSTLERASHVFAMLDYFTIKSLVDGIFHISYSFHFNLHATLFANYFEQIQRNKLFLAKNILMNDFVHSEIMDCCRATLWAVIFQKRKSTTIKRFRL